MREGGAKRHVVSRSVMDSCGYLWGNINSIADSTLAAIPDGEDVVGSPCP